MFKENVVFLFILALVFLGNGTVSAHTNHTVFAKNEQFFSMIGVLHEIPCTKQTIHTSLKSLIESGIREKRLFIEPNHACFGWNPFIQTGREWHEGTGKITQMKSVHTTWEPYRGWVIAALAGMFFLVLLALLLGLKTRQQKKQLSRLETENESYRESNTILSQSQEIAQVGSWKLDLTTNKLIWSDEVYRIFGCDPKEIKVNYESFLEFIHPDDRDVVDEAYTNSLRNGVEKYEIEHRIIRKDTGEVRHVYERCFHTRGDDSGIIQSVGMVQDITERKKNEEFFKKSAERAKRQRNLIAELSFHDAFVHSRVDEALRLMTTRLAEALQVHRTSVWLISEDQTQLSRLMLHDADTGIHPEIEVLNTADIPSYTHALKTDSQIAAKDALKDPRTKELAKDYFLPLHINSLLDSAIQQDGRLIGVLSAEHRHTAREWHTDEKSFLSAVTHLVAQLFANAERKRVEEERKKLELIAESSNEFIGMFDLDMNPVYVNPAGRQMVGLPDIAAACEVKVKDYFFPEDQAFIEKKFFPRVLREGHGSVEIQMRHFQTHEPIWVRYHLFRVIDSNNEPVGWATVSSNISEQKSIEMALRESEARFRNIMASMSDTVYTLDRNQRHTGVFGPWVKKQGLSPELFLGKTAREILGAEDAEVHEKANARALKGEMVSYEWTITKDSDIVYYQTTLSPIYNDKKEVEGLVGVGRDITEIRKAEKALYHSYELMQYIIEHDQSAVAVHDKDLNYIYVSQRYLRDYRVKEQDIIGKHHYEVFPDIPEKWRKVHQRALEGEVLNSEEDYFLREDGTHDWTRWECRPWYETDGSVGGIVLYTEVINDRKQKELEIKKLNQRLHLLIESIQQLSSAQSLEDVQDIVAKSARRLIGADGATLVYKEEDDCFYVNEDAIQPLWKGKRFKMDSCISGWVMQNNQQVIIKDVFSDKRIPKDVYKPTFVNSLAMVPVNVSEPIGAIGNYWKEPYTPGETEMQLLQTLADAAARALESIHLYNELEDRVKKRTEQLHSVNKELETFTYSVSHDLKAPLRHINGYVDLLESKFKEELPEKAQHYLNTISSASSQMGTLIEDLLQYSRTGRKEVKKTELDMSILVKEVQDLLKTATG
ncbi:PAS domain S-box protein, partial [Balneolaceae bacterium ANBcel3]|nr:PAS domain S-box protein [Balneolaceae bacterium ANBcel3]